MSMISSRGEVAKLADLYEQGQAIPSPTSLRGGPRPCATTSIEFHRASNDGQLNPALQLAAGRVPAAVQLLRCAPNGMDGRSRCSSAGRIWQCGAVGTFPL